jgi:hypothetical protein
VAGRTSIRRRGRGDVDDSWVNQNATHGIFLINGKVPHGPIMGCHVAPLYWILVCYVKFYWSPWGSTLGPHHRCNALTKSARPIRPYNVAYHMMVCIVFTFECLYIWAGVGPGLSPGPWSYCYYIWPPYMRLRVDITKPPITYVLPYDLV